MTISCAQETLTVCTLGMESVGKSTLLQSLTGTPGRSEALRGSTLYCQSYSEPSSEFEYLDTPGITRQSDSATTQEALQAISSHSTCLVVLRAFSAQQELDALSPLLNGKRVSIALTNRDLLSTPVEQQEQILKAWRAILGVPVTLVNSTDLAESEKRELRRSAREACPFKAPPKLQLPGFQLAKERKDSLLLDNRYLASLLLLGPTLLVTFAANSLAEFLEPTLDSLLGRIPSATALPPFVQEALTGPYGLVSMLPFLFLYALPTIVLLSFVLALYRSSGLLDRLSQAVHPLLSPIGLSGRDAVRVIMGWGCNVPAVVSTRACHSCSRGACVSAIAFGAACSYQMPATLAVFSAAGHPELALWYLLSLLVSTAIYLRFTTPKALRQLGRRRLLEEKALLYPVNWKRALQDTKGSLGEFFNMALPIFLGICLGASLLHYVGFLSALTRVTGPIMSLFHLPPEVATAVILGSVRKDGIAIGLLNPSWEALKVPALSSGQLLTSIYLAGVFLPCLVTLLTIWREMGWRYALKLAFRQAAWATGFSICLGFLSQAF